MLSNASQELTSTQALDSQHFLWEGPFSRAWYLGARVASQYFPCAEALQFVLLPLPAGMRSTHLLTRRDLLPALERQPEFLKAGDYTSFCLASLTPLATATPPAWPRAPTFVSFHTANGEEEHLTLTPCATQLYTLPAYGLSSRSSHFGLRRSQRLGQTAHFRH